MATIEELTQAILVADDAARRGSRQAALDGQLLAMEYDRLKALENEPKPAEIPTTPLGFAADVYGGIPETVPVLGSMLAQGVFGPIAGGVGAVAGLFNKQGVSKTAQEYKHATEKALDYSPRTYFGRTAKEGVSKVFEEGIKGVGKGYETARNVNDLVQNQMAVRGVGFGEKIDETEYAKRMEEARIRNEVYGEGVSKATETALAVEGARVPLASLNKGIKSFKQSRATAQEQARITHEKTLAQQGIQKDIEATTIPYERAVNVEPAGAPELPKNLPRGSRKPVEAEVRGDSLGNVYPGERAGSRHTRPGEAPEQVYSLPKEGQPATPKPADNIPPEMLEGGRRSTLDYTWKYPDKLDPVTGYSPEQMGQLDLRQPNPKPKPGPQEPTQLPMNLQPRPEHPMTGKRVYQPSEVIYDNLPDKLAQQRQQARTASEGIPYEPVRIAQQAEARQARVAEATGTTWEPLPDGMREAIARINATGRMAGEARAAQAAADVPSLHGFKPIIAPKKAAAWSEVLHQMSLGDTTVTGALRTLASSNNLGTLDRAVSRVLSSALKESGVTIELASNSWLNNRLKVSPDQAKNSTINGIWSSKDGKIYLNKEVPLDPATLIHEAVHAVVYDWQVFQPNSVQSRVIQKLYDIASARSTELQKKYQYGLQDAKEFVAEIMADDIFRKEMSTIMLSPAEATHIRALLSQVKSMSPTIRTIRTAWDAFVSSVSSMLGNKIPEASLSKIAFEAGLTITKDLGDPKIQAIRNYGARSQMTNLLNKKMSDLVAPSIDFFDINSFKSASPQPSSKGSRSDIVSAATGETRTPKQFMDSIGGKIADLPDSSVVSLLKNISNVSALFRETKNPFLSYLLNFAENNRALAKMQSELLKEGAVVDLGSRFPRKIIDPNSPLQRLRTLSSNKEQVTKAMEVINEFGGKEIPSAGTLMQRGLSQPTIDTLNIVQKSLQEVHNMVSEARKASGKPPFQELPWYWMKYFGEGNWISRIKDKQGHTLWSRRNLTKDIANENAAAMLQKLKERGIDGDIIVGSEAEVRGNKFNVNTSVLEDMLSVLEKGDPRRAVIQSIEKEIHSGRGFAVHGKHRKNVLGGEFRNSGDLIRAYENYVDGAFNYVSNLKISQAIGEIARDNRIPTRLNHFAQGYLNRVRGAVDPGESLTLLNNAMDAVVSKAIGTIAKVPGGGSFLDVSGLRHMSSAKVVIEALNKTWMNMQMLALNLPFSFGNFTQSSGFGWDVLQSWKYHKGVKGDITSSMTHAYTDMLSKGTDFATYRDSFAVPRGQIDPTFIQEVGARGALLGGRTVHLGGKQIPIEQIVDYATLRVLPTKAEQFSRLHAHASAYNFAKSAGLKGKELYQTAEMIANDIMVNYGKADKMAFIENSGIVGTAMKPLMTFNNWYWSSTMSYIKEVLKNGIRDPKVITPLTTRIAVTGIYAGITGSTAWTVIDHVWDMIRNSDVGKKIFGVKNSTASLSELALQHFSDPVLFGMFDAATTLANPRGAHIAGGLMAPELRTPEVIKGLVGDPKEYAFQGGALRSVPGIKFGVDMTDVMYTTVKAILGKDVSSGELRTKVKNIMPPMIDRVLDYFDLVTTSKLEEGYPISIEPRDPDLPRPSSSPRNYTGPITDKDAYERGVHVAFGNTLPQQREILANRAAKEKTKEIGDRRRNVIDLYVDHIIYGKGNPEELIDKVVDLGYTTKEFRQAVKEAYRNRILEEDLRRTGKSSSRREEMNTRRELMQQ